MLIGEIWASMTQSVSKIVHHEMSELNNNIKVLKQEVLRKLHLIVLIMST
jgi:hypothetical protein